MTTMKNMFKQILLSIMVLALLTNCSQEPKVIAPTTNSPDALDKASIFSQDHPSVVTGDAPSELAAGIHTVVALEVLPTVRYVYLRVREGQDEFWIATIKREITIGGTYFYQGGLLKTNFESMEHKRVFDKMYLVSSVIEAEHSSHVGKQAISTPSEAGPQNIDVAGSTKISDLVAKPGKYEGKFIQVTGECVKVNPNIMGRNWVHLRDGSGTDFDLVITCDVQIPVGHQVTMTGRVVLNRDFGSGYEFSILLEEGKLVQ